MRIVFLGTPDFAVPTLEAICAAGFDVVAVVTAPDRPAGRGLQLRSSPVKNCAVNLNIPVLQPEKLRDPQFLEELQKFRADIQVVVAFRMLPELVWNMPSLGTWNLHASLLPNYRGAAPINHAIINGEKETGLSTFKLVHAIDQGAIALQRKLAIGPDETAGELHDKMMLAGAALMTDTLKQIHLGTMALKPQESFPLDQIREAPKLTAAFCQIRFNQSASHVHNHIRGLSPFPGAHCSLVHGTESQHMKLFRTQQTAFTKENTLPGTLQFSDDGHIYVRCLDAWLEIIELQQAGKKRMHAQEYLKGLRNHGNLRLE